MKQHAQITTLVCGPVRSQHLRLLANCLLQMLVLGFALYLMAAKEAQIPTGVCSLAGSGSEPGFCLEQDSCQTWEDVQSLDF